MSFAEESRAVGLTNRGRGADRVGASTKRPLFIAPPRTMPHMYPFRKLSKTERRGVVSMRPQGGSSVRKTNGATYKGSRHAGAFLANSR